MMNLFKDESVWVGDSMGTEAFEYNRVKYLWHEKCWRRVSWYMQEEEKASYI